MKKSLLIAITGLLMLTSGAANAGGIHFSFYQSAPVPTYYVAPPPRPVFIPVAQPVYYAPRPVYVNYGYAPYYRGHGHNWHRQPAYQQHYNRGYYR